MSASATSLGELLRQERLRKQLNLATIARETRICPAILDSIEKDRFDSIPGGSYRRHFLRQYACALGMDGDAVVAEFQKHYEEPPVPLPIPPKTRRSSVWAELAWALGVIAALTVTYEGARNLPTAARHLQRATVQAPPISSAERAAPEPAAPDAAAPNPAAPAAAAPAAAETARRIAAVHVGFTATEPVWISVKCDGNASYAGLLDVPQSRTFEAAGAVTALIGNAGGVQVTVNGKSVGSLGAHGEVEMIEVTVQGARRIPRPQGAADTGTAPQL